MFGTVVCAVCLLFQFFVIAAGAHNNDNLTWALLQAYCPATFGPRLPVSHPARRAALTAIAARVPRRQNLLASGAVGAARRREAEESYRAAIRAQPDYAHAYNNLANVLRDGGSDEALRQAGRAYGLAVRLAPQYLEAYRNLGNLLKERGPWRWAALARA